MSTKPTWPFYLFSFVCVCNCRRRKRDAQESSGGCGADGDEHDGWAVDCWAVVCRESEPTGDGLRRLPAGLPTPRSCYGRGWTVPPTEPPTARLPLGPAGNLLSDRAPKIGRKERTHLTYCRTTRPVQQRICVDRATLVPFSRASIGSNLFEWNHVDDENTFLILFLAFIIFGWFRIASKSALTTSLFGAKAVLPRKPLWDCLVDR